MVNSLLLEILGNSVSIGEELNNQLSDEFNDKDYLLIEYMEESKSRVTINKPSKYKKGNGKCFDYEVNMIGRKHQEYFIFLGLSFKKGFKKVPEHTPSRGHKRTRHDRLIKCTK